MLSISLNIYSAIFITKYDRMGVKNMPETIEGTTSVLEYLRQRGIPVKCEVNDAAKKSGQAIKNGSRIR